MTSKLYYSTMVALWLMVAAAGAQPSQAQTFKVLHTFQGGKHDGADPGGVLVRDSAGNLYGTTGYGGTGGCQYGCGTVFKLNDAGKQVWLHSFKGGNGSAPVAGLVRNAGGNLFGTTEYGGVTTCGNEYGCGTVFKLNGTGTKETVLHRFTFDPDGYYPEALPVEDDAGNLYGTASLGGTYGVGVVFKVAPNGKETILYNFTGGSDGCGPSPGAILDSVGNLYGVATRGGDGDCNNGHGVVFEVDTAGKETVLHTFGGADGALPDSVLLFDSKGNLYGTTVFGGSGSGCGNSGCGTVFELSPQSGGGWSERVLYSFCSLINCTDGEEPDTGPLVRDTAGNLYGTAVFGGNIDLCNGSCGVVFKLDSTGTESVLHTFTGGSDGAIPFAGLIMDGRGNLYGTTAEGGSICIQSFTCGVVFKLDGSGGETVLYNFTGGTDGYYPLTGVTLDAQGTLYGTATGGGVHGDGTLFKITP
jgi:uncharacterized repeat protein (TIGR03803 family)